MFGLGKSRAAKAKIDRSTAQVLELEALKKSLQMEKEQISLELENLKKKEEMKLETEIHKHKLKLESERAVFDREKAIWAKEKKEIVDRAAREKEEFESTLKKEMELKTNESITLTKLEAQQKIKQAELDKDRELTKLSSAHAKEIAELQSTESEKYYDKLTEAFQEIQLNGDKNSRFVQDLALKIFDKVPTARTEVGVDVNAPKQLAAVSED